MISQYLTIFRNKHPSRSQFWKAFYSLILKITANYEHQQNSAYIFEYRFINHFTVETLVISNSKNINAYPRTSIFFLPHFHISGVLWNLLLLLKPSDALQNGSF